MFDHTAIAKAVSRWTGLGVKLPNELATAIDVFEALLYTEVGYQAQFDLAEVTAANAEEKIKEFADQLVLSEVPGGGLSVLGKAKNYAVEAAARRVNAVARASVSAVIELLTPEFNRHAEAYADAVRKLPGDPDVNNGKKSTTTLSERLVAAGPDAVTAFGQAQQEVQYLHRVSSWVASTGQLSGTTDMEVALRILRPSTYSELERVDAAARRRNTDPAIAAIDPVFFAAVRGRVEFGINTLSEAAGIRSELQEAAAKSVRFA